MVSPAIEDMANDYLSKHETTEIKKIERMFEKNIEKGSGIQYNNKKQKACRQVEYAGKNYRTYKRIYREYAEKRT